MKRILIFLVCLAIGKSTLATEWAWYYVYIQTDYMQGPWTRAEILYKNNETSAYLHPVQCEDLFGSQEDLTNAILKHLKENDVPRYKFRAIASINKDTVIIRTNDTIPDFEAVKNELTASYVLNNFAAVRIIQKNKTEIFQLKDISVPYMDLFLPDQAQALSTTSVTGVLPKNEKNTVSAGPEPKHSLNACKNESHETNSWLILSVVLNVLLIGWLLIRKKNDNKK